MKEVKRQYDSMLENGDLEILFPNMTGNWKKDKEKFIKRWSENEKFLNQITTHEKPTNK